MPARPARSRWTIRLGSVGGVDVQLHVTLLLLLAWVALTQRPAGLHAVVGATIGLVVVFGVILLHELGHVFAARAFGVRTLDVTLLPFGGVSRMERTADTPWKELLVALAGPAVNFALAGICALAVIVAPRSFVAAGVQLVWLNLGLAIFNLVPASPMDGGRVLRAALAMRLGSARATEIAASIGLAFAVLLGGLGLMFQPMLVFVALFVGIGASAEIARARMERDLAGERVRDVMIRDFVSVAPDVTLRDASLRAASGFQRDLPVVDRGVVVGMLTDGDLREGLRTLGPDARASQVMHAPAAVASPDEPILRALERLDDADTLVVAVDGRPVGVVTTASVDERVQLEEAMRRPPTPHPRH